MRLRPVLRIAVCIASIWVVYLLTHGQSWLDDHPRREKEPPVAATAPPREKPPPPKEKPLKKEDGSARVHVVFSTDCSGYQDWQTEVVVNSALLVGHQGPLTRIASGCDQQSKKRLEERYRELYGAKLHAHFTPEFSQDQASGKKYHFYNKPRGIEHWLFEKGSTAELTDVIALIDPDFLFLKPLSDELGDSTVVRSPWKLSELPYRKVARGQPVGQQYGLGAQWTTFDRKAICGPKSPCLDVDRFEANKYYPVGPPYVLHRDDWKSLAPVWRDFAPKVYKQYPHLLAEMYAYCCAAAHLGLRHLRVNHMMLSNVHAGDEAWDLVDNSAEIKFKFQSFVGLNSVFSDRRVVRSRSCDHSCRDKKI